MKITSELTEFLETHFEVVSAIAIRLHLWDGNESSLPSIIKQRHDEQGQGGMYELSIELTKEFQKLHKDTMWGVDLDWLDTVDEFLTEKFK